MSSPGSAAAEEGVKAVDGAAGAAKTWKELRGALMVVASLIATSTYQAAVNPPSGLKEADGNRFYAFRFLNSFSFVNSVGIMMQLLLEAVVTGNALSVTTMKVLMTINLLFFAAAFAFVVSHSWASTSYAMVSPIYYFIMCLIIELAFKRKQKKEESLRRSAPASTVAAQGEDGSHSSNVEKNQERPSDV